MLPFRTLITINKKAAVPVYRQIANGVMNLIRNGILKPGASLPSSREMALFLQVHRKTIVAAYDELYAQDLIEKKLRKGVMVAQHLPAIKPRSFKAAEKSSGYATGIHIFSAKANLFSSQTANAENHRLILNDGFPDARIAPVDALMKEYRRLFARNIVQRKVMYGNRIGAVNLRAAIARMLADTRGMQCSVNNILISGGAQMAVHMAASMLIKPGSTVVVAEPNYRMANMIFQHFGAKLLRVAVDENGIDVDMIEKICKKQTPALLYIIPHHHHPTTVTLSADRRMRLLQLIGEHKLPVIEDDYDYDFHYSSSPIIPLASGAHNGHVIYIGSLSKCLAPTMRVGYMVAPENFINEAARLRMLIDIRGDTLLEESLAMLFNDGDMQRHLKKSLKLYHQRCDQICTLMEKELSGILSFSKPSGGMAVWARFNKKYSLPAIAQRASTLGLYMSDGSFYNSGTVDYNALRIGFASLNEKEMEETISIIKKAAYFL